MFLSGLDAGALLASLLLWVGYSVVANLPSKKHHSLAAINGILREIWMRRMCDNEVRVADSALMGNLMRSVAFFASASILVLSGLVALIGTGERAFEVFQTLPFHDASDSFSGFEFKAVLLVCVFIYAFIQITWSLRQFNYACILMGAAPVHTASAAEKEQFVKHASHLSSLAGHSFDMGLRAYYFALGMLPWFISAWLFMVASVLVVLIIYRREFKSQSLHCLRHAVTVQL